MQKMSEGLDFLLKRHEVPTEIRARLVQLGFKSAEVWAKVDDTTALVRAFILRDVGLVVEGNDEYRSQVAGLLACWEAAVLRGAKKRQAQAEEHVGDMPHRLSKQEHTELVRAYNRATGKELKETQIPAHSTIEQKLDQIKVHLDRRGPHDGVQSGRGGRG